MKNQKNSKISQMFKNTIMLALSGLGVTQILASGASYIDPKYRSLDLQDITPITKEMMEELKKKASMFQNEQEAPEVDPEESNPYFPVDPIRGYIDIYDKDNSMWYWLARARNNPDTAPIIIFFEGGPGGASSFDYVGPSGPFKFYKKNFSKVHPRAYLKGNTTWAENAHVLYPDFPLGVGFSTVTSRGLSFNGKQVQEQVVLFYTKFLEIYPEFKGRPIYVTGISYGGHWVPYATTALKYSGNPDINVKGFYISSGLMDYKKATESYIDFALENFKYTGFTQEQAIRYEKLYDLCLQMIDLRPNKLYTIDWFNVCENKAFLAMMKEIREKKPKFNNHDIAGNYTFDLTPFYFLNNSKVLKFAAVKQKEFQPINMTFFYFFAPRDVYVVMEPLIARLLNDGVKGAVAAGTLDLICNYKQSEGTIASVKWKWQEQYNAVKMTPCNGGLCKEFKNLREYRVFGSGHGICVYQPEIAAEIVDSLIKWEPEM